MKILIVNPPHLSIGSRMANEHLPPLGLLWIAGPLIDHGFTVDLLDADFHNYKKTEIVLQTQHYNPDIVLMGHSGSSSAQPIIDELAIKIKEKLPAAKIIIGGVFPTYHWKEIMLKNSAIDYIICGEGEKICLELIVALKHKKNLQLIKGIVFRENEIPIQTPRAENIKNLDEYRIAWEFLNKYHYTYWGKRKAVVVQFSRGCPYPCTYCGQSIFWDKWRCRNPQIFADEIEMLHKKYNIEIFNFADENPSSNPKLWREFIQILAAKNLPIVLVGSIRADNIVRDKEYLHFYKKAGFERFLLGIENYQPHVLKQIKKAGSITKDMEAIQLLRQHGILSMATYVVGFGEEKWKDFYFSLKQLLHYDPDQIQLLYATPHKWTPYYEEVKDREIILDDQRYWDYKHQVLKTSFIKPWIVIVLVKIIELIVQTRPKALYRNYFQKDKKLRKAMQWYSNIGKRVWLWELYQYFFKIKHVKNKKLVQDFWD